MNIMRNTKAALVAALLAAGALAPVAATPAHAASVQFNSGNVAFGYSDGYWDRSHQWHRWPNTAARTDWRKTNKEHYYTHAHTHDKGGGWHDSDHWWEH
ncbi:MAG TPA: hypothetical protein VHY80_20035 [Stellaceae bacterium]|jgi:hypothetical protein|nr:hypothetical protein [Stellaceae bacterium]